jgi:hypothetical protein
MRKPGKKEDMNFRNQHEFFTTEDERGKDWEVRQKDGGRKIGAC